MLKLIINFIYYSNFLNVYSWCFTDRLSVQITYRSCRSELNLNIELSQTNFYSAKSGTD